MRSKPPNCKRLQGAAGARRRARRRTFVLQVPDNKADAVPCERLPSTGKTTGDGLEINKGGLTMGKGDQRSKRGKIHRGTYGKSRRKKKAAQKETKK